MFAYVVCTHPQRNTAWCCNCYQTHIHPPCSLATCVCFSRLQVGGFSSANDDPLEIIVAGKDKVRMHISVHSSSSVPPSATGRFIFFSEQRRQGAVSETHLGSMFVCFNTLRSWSDVVSLESCTAAERG